MDLSINDGQSQPKHHNKNTNKNTPLKTPGKRQKLEAQSLEELQLQYENLVKKDRELTEELAVWATKGLNLDLSAEMRALHEYNKTKDFAQVVLGYLSDVEQVTVKELYERYNLPCE